MEVLMLLTVGGLGDMCMLLFLLCASEVFLGKRDNTYEARVPMLVGCRALS